MLVTHGLADALQLLKYEHKSTTIRLLTDNRNDSTHDQPQIVNVTIPTQTRIRFQIWAHSQRSAKDSRNNRERLRENIWHEFIVWTSRVHPICAVHTAQAQCTHITDMPQPGNILNHRARAGRATYPPHSRPTMRCSTTKNIGRHTPFKRERASAKFPECFLGARNKMNWNKYSRLSNIRERHLLMIRWASETQSIRRISNRTENIVNPIAYSSINPIY